MDIDSIIKNLYLSKSKDKDLEIFKTFKGKQPVKEYLPIISFPGSYQADILFFEPYAKYNGGIKMLLVIVEALTRQITIYPMKKKSESFEHLKDFVENHPDMKVFTSDAGTEFVNNNVKNMMEEYGIQVHNTTIKKHVGIVERANRTIRQLITRFMTLTGSYEYIEYLPKFIEAYNSSTHRSLNLGSEGYPSYRAPDSVSLEDKYKLIERTLDKHHEVFQKIMKKFKPGMKIRIKRKKELFEKGATANYSLKVYTIKEVKPPYLITEDGEKIHYMDALPVSEESRTIAEPTTSVKKLVKEQKIEKQQKAEDIDQKNIVEGKRNIKKPKKLDL